MCVRVVEGPCWGVQREAHVDVLRCSRCHRAQRVTVRHQQQVQHIRQGCSSTQPQVCDNTTQQAVSHHQVVGWSGTSRQGDAFGRPTRQAGASFSSALSLLYVVAGVQDASPQQKKKQTTKKGNAVHFSST